ncbi:MAG: TlpA disulfide reductase family protein [Bacteroidia bacterium]|nr:TlpA disulfide reductase family protein [Bacteroidia bacterium]
MISLKRAWATYKKKKTRLGIVLDFCLVGLIIFISVPDLRMRLMVNSLRLTLRQPQVMQDEHYMLSLNSLNAYTAEGDLYIWPDTLQKPLLLNFGALWSPQNRAELKSLNHLWESYGKDIDVIYLTFDDVEEVEEYMQKRDYGFKRLYLREDELSEMSQEDYGLIVNFVHSIPSSVLLDRDSKIVIKKFGAAKWTGNRVDEIVAFVVN